MWVRLTFWYPDVKRQDQGSYTNVKQLCTCTETDTYFLSFNRYNSDLNATKVNAC